MLNKIRCIIIIETTFFSIQYHPAETICVIWTNFYYSNCSYWKQTVQRNQSAFSVKDQFTRMVIKFDFKLTKLLQVMCLTYLELPLCEKYIENLNSFNGLMDWAFVTFLIKNYYNFHNSHYYAQSQTARVTGTQTLLDVKKTF